MTTTLPVPKYAIGQTVWCVNMHTTRDRWPCPDCNDTKVWSAQTVVGETFSVTCPRCSGGSLPRNVPSLDRLLATATARNLTVGSVRIDTAARDGWEPVEYMCVETGVGSGSVYRESLLFNSESAALAEAEIRNKQEQVALDARPDVMRSAEYGKWPLSLALGRDWSDTIYNSWLVARNYREAMEKIINGDSKDHCDCDPVLSLDDARNVLRDELSDRPWRKPHPVDALVAAASAMLAGDSSEARQALETALAGIAYELPPCAVCGPPPAVDAVARAVDPPRADHVREEKS